MYYLRVGGDLMAIDSTAAQNGPRCYSCVDLRLLQLLP